MSRDPILRLQDMVEACQTVAKYIDGIEESEFGADSKTCDAVIRQFEIVGEAAKHIPADWKKDEPDIPWSRVCGFRDVLTHGYFAIDSSIVWDAATVKAPLLLAACNRLIQKYG